MSDNKQIVADIDRSLYDFKDVEDEKDFMRSVRHDLANDVADLGQLVHEIDTVMEPAGGIDKHYVGIFRHG